MLDNLFRRRNPTNKWSRQANLSLTVDLSTYSLNSVPVGSRVEKFSFLGRSSSSSKSVLEFTDLGLSLDYEDDGTVSGFRVVWVDTENQFSEFKGTIRLNGSAIKTGNLLNELGECYWLDKDEYELLHFYEYPTHELQIEQSHEKQIRCMIVTKDFLMADPEQRQAYGVDKPWPPY